MVEIDSVATIIDTSETVRMIASIAVAPDPKKTQALLAKNPHPCCFSYCSANL
jgi:hypothetical protein